MKLDLKLDRKQLLNTDKALAYVNAARAEKGIKPIKYHALLKHLRKHEIQPQAMVGHKHLWNPADLQCAVDVTDPVKIPDGYERLSKLMPEVNDIRISMGATLFDRVDRLTTLLWQHNCPKVKVNLPQGGIANYYDRDKVFKIIKNIRCRTPSESLYNYATKEELLSPDWVETPVAADMIGCTRAEINDCISRRSVNAVIAPNGRLLCDWQQCKELLCWRQKRTIVKFMGEKGFDIIKNTRESKILGMTEDGMHFRAWYVPELIEAFRTNKPVTAHKSSVTIKAGWWTPDIVLAFVNDIRQLYGYTKFNQQSVYYFLQRKNVKPNKLFGEFVYQKNEVIAAALDLPKKINRIDFIRDEFSLKKDIPDGYISAFLLSKIANVSYELVRYRCESNNVPRIKLTYWACDPTGRQVRVVYEKQAALAAVKNNIQHEP